MSDSYKRLGALAPSDGKHHVLYTAPEGKDALISNITLANRNSQTEIFDIDISEETLTDNDIASIQGFLAVNGDTYGSLSKVFKSTDGISWSQKEYPLNQIPGAQWKSVAYGYSTYYAVADNPLTSTFIKSTDSTTWTTGTFPVSDYWKKIVYANGRFISIATQQALTLTDGSSTWSISNTFGTTSLNDIAYGNGAFVVVGSDNYEGSSIYRSTDGTTWAQVGPQSAGNNWQAVTYGGGKFFATQGSQGEGIYYGISSTDGITWTNVTTLPYGQWNNVTFGNGKFVVLADQPSTAISSTDLSTWTSAPLPADIQTTSIKYALGKFLVTGMFTNSIFYSTDGVTWTAAAISETSQNVYSTISGNINYIFPISSSLYSQSNLPGNTSEVLEPGIIVPSGASLVIKSNFSNITQGITASVYGVEVTSSGKNKILSKRAAHPANIATPLYTVPAGKQTIVRSINIVNTGSSATTYSLWIGNTSYNQSIAFPDQDCIAYEVSIAAKETITIKAGYTLDSGYMIHASSTSGTGLVNVSIYGMEI